jgi:hypothetical protein
VGLESPEYQLRGIPAKTSSGMAAGTSVGKSRTGVGKSRTSVGKSRTSVGKNSVRSGPQIRLADYSNGISCQYSGFELTWRSNRYGRLIRLGI